MAVSFPTQLLIFRKAKGKPNINNSQLLRNSHVVVRQMNMDYSFCQALSYNSEGLPGGLGAYDIFCQWIIHFLERVENSEYLSVPDLMEIVGGVGKWHLAGHVPGCFALNSLNFLPGAAQLDGEIVETLWAEFNKISESARSMSAAHRREVYDDHMRESNWKKIISMGG